MADSAQELLHEDESSIAPGNSWRRVGLGIVDNRSNGGAQEVGPSRTLERIRHTFSYTSLNAYYSCPRQFEWKYLTKPNVPFFFKKSMAIGGVVHKTLAKVLGLRRDG